MEPVAIRVNLGKDEHGQPQWWDVKPVQTQGMRKQIKKQAQNAMTEKMRMEGSATGMSMEVVDFQVLTEQIEAQTLIQMSVGWSWPTPINSKTLDDRETWIIDAVLQRMNDLYSRTLEQIKALEKNLQEPS